MTDDHAHPMVIACTGKVFEDSHPELVRLYTPKIESRFSVKRYKLKNDSPRRMTYNNWFKVI